ARYGISRKTGYKWLARYQALGMDGLQERSRRPWGHARQTPYTLQQAIIELRQSGRGLRGPKKIRELLAMRYPDADLPGLTTIYHVLKRAGLITSTRRRRRVAPTARPFASVQA
ncbi:helix-turn-helix domain-containing protein, partial [Salinisphaera sp. P385]